MSYIIPREILSLPLSCTECGNLFSLNMPKDKKPQGSSTDAATSEVPSNIVSHLDNFEVIKLLLENHFKTSELLYQAQKERQDRHEDSTKHELFTMKQRQDILEKVNHDLVTRLAASEAKNINLEAKLQKAHDNINELEQHGRRTCIVVNNLPSAPGKTDQEMFTTMCKDKMKFDEATVQIVKNKIAKIHRIGKGITGIDGTPKPRPLVVNLTDDRHKDMIYRHKKILKGTGIVISELLTPARSTLLKKCYELIKGTHLERSIWTDNGRILVKKAGTQNIVNITNEKELETYVRDFFPMPTTTV